MSRQKLNKLSTLVNQELEKVKSFVEKTKESADELAKTAASSPSQSGDREHSRGQANIAKDHLKRVLELKKEIDNSLKSLSPEIISPPCFVKYINPESKEMEVYLVHNPIFLSNTKQKIVLVSAHSMLGKELSGKKVGDKFLLFIPNEEAKIYGEVLEIG